MDPMNDPTQQDRRRYLRRMLLAAGAMITGMGRVASAAELLGERDPAALAQDYVASARNVDRRKYPSFDGHQNCANCALVESGTAIRRHCSVFPGKLVLPNAWCKAWQPKGRKL